MQRRLVVSAVALALFALTVAVFAGTLVASGSQTRGTAGNNAKLSGAAFTLPAPATIAKVEGSGAGFWIQGGSGTVGTFSKDAQGVGFQLKAGTYWVYPNLPSGQSQASVKVTFTW